MKYIHCFLFTLLLFQINSCKLKQKGFEEKTEDKITSENPRHRREAIHYIKDKGFGQFSPQLILIIYNEKYSEEERYFASDTLASVKPLRARESIHLLFDQKNRILINCAIQMIITLLKNDPYTYDLTQYAPLIFKHNLAYHDSHSQKRSLIALGLLKYKKAYVPLINRIIGRVMVSNELIEAVAYLGDDKKNKFIQKVLLHLESEYRDNRYTRSIRKALYILRENNSYNPLFESRLMDHLSNLSSDFLPHSMEGETYFRFHHYADWEDLKEEFGNAETYDPKKIDYIINNRIPLLLMALKDHSPKLRFKAAKLLGDLGNSSCCDPLMEFYNENQSSSVLSDISIEALAKLQCEKYIDLIKKHDPDPGYLSPLYYFFINNPEIYRKQNEIFINYPMLFSLQELFPENESQIRYLLNHNDPRIRLKTIYVLSQNNDMLSHNLLKMRLNLEDNPSLKNILKSILRKGEGP